MRRANLLPLLLIVASCTTGGIGPLGLLRQRLPPPDVAPDATGYTFRYQDISATSVYVAGQFNQWANSSGDRNSIKMKQGGDGLWTVTVPFKEHTRDPRYDELSDDVYLEHGNRYQYKLVVDPAGWITDPANTSTVDDGTGNKNSLLVVP